MPELLPFHDNETVRLNALKDLNLLDTPPSEAFDRLTRLAGKLFQAPVSTISLTDHDRQWFKSKFGIDHAQIPREQSPCSYAIGGRDIFVVRDLSVDPRFAGTPLAEAGVKFYAGAPLFTRCGHGLGTICVIDWVPRDFAPQELAVLKDLAGMVMAQIELQNLIGQVDAATGAPNQQRFLADIEDMQDGPGAATLRQALLVEVLGADRMADLAQTLGSGVADEMLRAPLRLIREQAGPAASVYHVGPTRFAVTLGAATGDSEPIVDAIETALANRINAGGVPIALDPAIGCYGFSAAAEAPRDILRHLQLTATEARYCGGRAVYAPGQQERCARRFALINDFAAALEDDRQLRLLFQPRIDLKTGRWVGVEALLRWNHPELGLISPGEFIPLVERTALARPLMDWVARSAFTTKAVWASQGINLRMSINASALNLDEPDFAERLLAIIDQCRVDAAEVEIEFTESAMARDPARVVRHMEKLRANGVTLAIDDFGTGYSNLSYVQQLPVSILKIDQSFIRKLDISERARKLVKAMLGIADDLGYAVVAEGVETQSALDLLRGWNCAEGQGFHLAMPMSSRQIAERYDARIGAAA